MHLKVLIIEDCEDDALLLARYLKSCGFEPKWQRVDYQDALIEAVDDRRWDLVLCDFSMPQLTPYIAVDSVRVVNPDIPIIIVTGALSDKAAVNLLQHGVQDVVLKDDLPRLKAAISRELGLARQRREKAAAEQRFAAALDNLSQGVALFDTDARLITCNRNYRIGLDRCQDDICPGMYYGDLVNLVLERRQYVLGDSGADTVLQRLLAYDKPTGTTPIEARHHDGRWTKIQRQRTAEGGILTIVTDITEAKRREEALVKQTAALAQINKDLETEIQQREATEEALRESENRARAIFEWAVDGVIIFNEDHLIEVVNPAAETMFGYNSHELEGLHIHHIMLIGDDTEEETDEAEEAGQDTQLPHVRSVTGWRKNGKSFPIELTVSRVKLKNGRMVYTGIIRDVTERTKLDRLKTEFVSVVSHELRTPLTSIRGSLALLNTNAVGELPPRAQSMIQIGLENSERLLRLINDILDMEKIESGKMDFDYENLSLDELLDEAVRDNQAFLDQYKLNVVKELDIDSGLTIQGDHGRLMQVITNLLSNAAKYSPEGGTITLGANAGEDDVRIWIKDEGPGIPQSFQNEIFQKFAQADTSDTRQKSGTGLGLSIAKAIVEQHKGRIGFESTEGHGATFYFELPLHANLVEAQVPPLAEVQAKSA